MIDDIDRKLLNILQEDARISNAELARRVGMAPSGILERVKKLEERGLIRGYQARLDSKKLGSGLVAFAFVKSDERVGGIESAESLAAIPEVQEVHHIAGEDCYLIKIRVADVEALGRLLRGEGRRHPVDPLDADHDRDGDGEGIGDRPGPGRRRRCRLIGRSG